MARFSICLLIATCLALLGGQARAQSAGTGLPRILNLDSLSAEDQDLLLQYKDSFKNDFYEVLDVFRLSKQPKVDTTVYDMDRSSHIEIGLTFVSRELISGRIIALSTSKGRLIMLGGVGFYPDIAYYHKIGLYFGLSTTFYTDSAISHASVVPVVSPTAGYEHTFFKRWFLSLAYSRTFITYGSAESRLLLNNTLSISSSVNIWKKLIFGSALYFYWSSDHIAAIPADEKTSLEVELFVRKDFVIHNFIGAKEFTISPALNFYFANDNRTYVTALGVTDVNRNAKKDTIVRTQNINDFFGFLDLEPSVNFDWRIRNLDICLTPTLAVPFNIFLPLKDERILNPRVYRFYLQAGIKYLFCVKKKPKPPHS